MAWSAQTLQFVIFFTPRLGQPDALQPWFKLFGTSPENFQRVGPGTEQEQSTALGMVGNYNFMVSATQGRYDLVISPNDEAMTSGSTPLIPDVDTAVAVLLAHAESMLDFQPALRLAIVAQLHEPYDTERDAAEAFGKHVGGLSVPTDGIDLSLQLNVRKHDDGTDQTMNRLCRWSTQRLQFMMVNMDSPTGPSSRPGPLIHGVGLLVDINTLASAQEFEKGKALAITNAIAGEVKKIISGGYGYVAS